MKGCNIYTFLDIKDIKQIAQLEMKKELDWLIIVLL